MSSVLMNSLWSTFADPLAQRWALALVHFLWQGLAVAAVYLALLPWINRRSAAAVKGPEELRSCWTRSVTHGSRQSRRLLRF